MQIGSIIILAVAVVMLGVMIFVRSKQTKKQQEEFYKFIDEVKVGDKVKTHIGIYGKVVSITETTDGKVFVLETGTKNKSEIEVDYRVLAGLDKKETVIYDSEGKPVTTGQLVVAKTLDENLPIDVKMPEGEKKEGKEGKKEDKKDEVKENKKAQAKKAQPKAKTETAEAKTTKAKTTKK